MLIGLLQFSPTLGDVTGNGASADALLEREGGAEGVDLLVLPELALTGYNFPSVTTISPYLEPAASGPSALWAQATAKRLKCVVSVGYPERTSNFKITDTSNSTIQTIHDPASQATDTRPQQVQTSKVTSNQSAEVAAAEIIPGTPILAVSELPPTSYPNYNSTITFDPAGKIIANYRKTHLYYTDATWAHPNPKGFHTQPIHFPPLGFPTSSTRRIKFATSSDHKASRIASDERGKPQSPTSIQTTFGICMDLNPRRFLAEETAFEFANHIVDSGADLVVCSMAWLTRLERPELGFASEPISNGTHHDDLTENPSNDEKELDALRKKPDISTLAYWLDRLGPVVRAPREVVVVIANRCGIEPANWSDSGRASADRTSDPLEEAGATPLGEGGDGANAPRGTSEARYAGTSTVMLLGKGRARIWGLMGRAEEGVLRVDTASEPRWELRVAVGEDNDNDNDNDNNKDKDNDDSEESDEGR